MLYMRHRFYFKFPASCLLAPDREVLGMAPGVSDSRLAENRTDELK